MQRDRVLFRSGIRFAVLLLLVSLCLPIFTTLAQSAPEDVAHAIIAAETAHDVDAAVALFADDAVVTLPTGVFDTPEAIRGWQEELAAGHFRLESVNVQADGDHVTWTGQIALDVFRAMGIASLDATWDLGIQDGKIRTFDFNFTPEAFTELQTGGVASGIIGAEQAHDVDAAMALFADDAVVTLPVGVYDTPDAIRAWQEELASGNFWIEPVGRRVDGNTTSWTGNISLDLFRAMGIASLDATWDLVIEGGKIKTFTFNFTPDAFAKLQAASAPESTPAPA